jgi:hypothetical protein
MKRDGEEILVDPEGSLSCPNEPITRPSRQPDESSSHLHPCLLRYYQEMPIRAQNQKHELAYRQQVTALP